MDTTDETPEEVTEFSEEEEPAIGRLTPEEYAAIGQQLADEITDGRGDDQLVISASQLWAEISYMAYEREEIMQQIQSLSLAVVALHDAAYSRGDVASVSAINELLRQTGALGPDETIPAPEQELEVPNRAERRRLEREMKRREN